MRTSLRVVCGLLLVALVPLAEGVAWFGSDNVSSLAGFLVGLAFFAAVPFSLGVAFLGPALSNSTVVRIGLGLLLIGWVATASAYLAAGGDYSSLSNGGRHAGRDKVLTVVFLGGVPALVGFVFIAWGVRDLVRARAR